MRLAMASAFFLLTASPVRRTTPDSMAPSGAAASSHSAIVSVSASESIVTSSR